MTRVIISIILLAIGFNLMIHSFNYEPILGVIVSSIFITIIYLTVKPLFKNNNEKAN
jgi:hypothetical protein